ncbi:hypothetical protein IAU60_000690 [Kwoniella sp. DSM 27419]
MSTISPLSGSPSSSMGNATPAPAVAVALPVAPKPATKTSKPRKRVNTAEKRSQHNAIERARRETLNGKFLSLAKLLPSLAASRRPSKSAIVNGSISHLTHQRSQRLLAAKMIAQMSAERDELLKEVNEWRKINGYAPRDIAHKWTEEMDEINSVEREVFGSFASMGGDDNDDDDQTESLESSVIFNGSSFANVNGLITPRSSTDLDLSLGSSSLYGGADTNRVAAAPVTGINWSSEFAFNLNQNIESAFGVATGSETHSSPNQVVVTPASETNLYMHTPSPASSHSIGSEPVSQPQTSSSSAVPAAPNGWTAQQFAFLQQQALQHRVQLRAHQQQQAQQSQVQQQPFNPILGNSFNAMFGGQSLGNLQQSQAQTDRFTQQMLANIFPRGIQPGPTQPSLEDIQNAVRAGMGVGMGMMGWPSAHGQTQSPNAVEGF